MYELCQIAPHTYYFDCPARVGVFETGEGHICLIDSGSDKSAAQRILRTLEQKRWTLDTIYNTHSHADHIGGNLYLQQQTACRIFAPDLEAAFIRYPFLEGALLYGGMAPAPLRHKFLLAQPSNARLLTDADLPQGLRAFSLPGHCLDMVGFETADGVAFIADSVSSEITLQKYGITYLFDVAAQLQTLQILEHKSAALFVPSHTEPTKDLSALVQINRSQILKVAETLCFLCQEACDTDTLIRRVFDGYGLRFSFEQYALVGSTVRSYLTWLSEDKKIQPFCDNNRLLWQTV